LTREIQSDEMGILLNRVFARLSSHIQRMLKTERDRLAVLRSACANLSAERVQRRVRSRTVSNRTPWATLHWHRDIRSRQISLIATLPRQDGMPDSLLVCGVEVVSNGGTYQALPISADWLEAEHRIRSDEGSAFQVPSLAEPLVFEAHGE